ncbi:MAG: hypothetical protein WB493_03800 [Anaeromyxobacteraceae bacterium]
MKHRTSPRAVALAAPRPPLAGQWTLAVLAFLALAAAMALR